MKQKRDVNPVHWDVMVRDRAVCQYCGLDGKTDVRVLCTLVLDHLQPKTCGLPWAEQEHRDNMVVSCQYCNVCKRDYNPAHDIVQDADPEVNRLRMIDRARGHVLERTGLLQTLDANYYADLFEHICRKPDDHDGKRFPS